MHDLIRGRRQELGLTCYELGERVGVRDVTIWRWESGRSIPASKHLARLADALAISVKELLAAQREAA